MSSFNSLAVPSFQNQESTTKLQRIFLGKFRYIRVFCTFHQSPNILTSSPQIPSELFVYISVNPSSDKTKIHTKRNVIKIQSYYTILVFLSKDYRINGRIHVLCIVCLLSSFAIYFLNGFFMKNYGYFVVYPCYNNTLGVT